MKKAIIVHGWGGSPGEAWQSWLKEELEKKGWEVETPEMPNSEEPKIDGWVSKLYDYKIDKKTYFVGHSIGCQAIMRYLERINGKLGGIVFVAPWTHLKGIEDEPGAVEIAEPWLETAINFERVREKTKKIICIFSDDDYYVPLSEKEVFENILDAETIVLHEKGHFAPEDGVIELPIILEKLDF